VARMREGSLVGRNGRNRVAFDRKRRAPSPRTALRGMSEVPLKSGDNYAPCLRAITDYF
jgi:hypothetical protein